MRAVLVFPPLVGASQPYSSLPALTAFVRSRGRHQIVQRDANLDFVVHLLSPAELRRAAGRVDERLEAMPTNGASRSDDDGLRRLLTASLKAPIVCDLIERAVEDLRRPDTYRDLGRLQHARRVVRDAFEIHSESCHPASLAIAYLSDEIGTAADLDRRARDTDNPFRGFFADVLLPAIERDNAAAIGLSITYPSQILPAVTLAVLARERLPDVTLVFGGQIASRWSVLPNVDDVFRWCDYLVCFEGETALDTLLSALECGDGLEAVPNLLYRERGRVVRTPTRVENVDALPTPDYGGLPLDRYLAPEPVFLLSTSRGCYWSACEFCSVSPSMRGRYRRRSIAALRRDITALRARHGARCVMFGDDCVAPGTLKQLAGVFRVLPAMSWECQVRFESALTAALLHDLQAAGCRNLAFGLESYSPRVLSSMNKGVRHAEIARILDDCRRAGIAFNLQLFFGFPGETESDARATVAFVVEQMHGAATVSAGTFELQRGSRMASRPQAFGLHVEPQPSLSIRLKYTPHSTDGVAMTQLVERELLARMRFADVPLSLDAHTLLFLHYAGVSAMARQYYGRSTTIEAGSPTLSPGLVVRRKANQTIRVLSAVTAETTPARHNGSDRILLYDYDSDRAVELSPLALCVLERLDGSRSVGDVSGSGDSADDDDLPATIAGIIGELLARQLVQ